MKLFVFILLPFNPSNCSDKNFGLNTYFSNNYSFRHDDLNRPIQFPTMKIVLTDFLISLFLFNLTVAYEDGGRRDVHNDVHNAVPRHLADLDEKISDIEQDAVTEQEYDGNKQMFCSSI